MLQITKFVYCEIMFQEIVIFDFILNSTVNEETLV